MIFNGLSIILAYLLLIYGHINSTIKFKICKLLMMTTSFAITIFLLLQSPRTTELIMYKIALFSLCYCCLLQVVRCTVAPGGILFPQDSETRQVMSLDGLWNFVLAPVNDPLVGFRDFWFKKDLVKVKHATFSLLTLGFMCSFIINGFYLQLHFAA